MLQKGHCTTLTQLTQMFLEILHRWLPVNLVKFSRRPILKNWSNRRDWRKRVKQIWCVYLALKCLGLCKNVFETMLIKSCQTLSQ